MITLGVIYRNETEFNAKQNLDVDYEKIIENDHHSFEYPKVWESTGVRIDSDSDGYRVRKVTFDRFSGRGQEESDFTIFFYIPLNRGTSIEEYVDLSKSLGDWTVENEEQLVLNKRIHSKSNQRDTVKLKGKDGFNRNIVKYFIASNKTCFDPYYHTPGLPKRCSIAVFEYTSPGTVYLAAFEKMVDSFKWLDFDPMIDSPIVPLE